MSVLYMTAGTCLGLVAMVLSLLNGASPALAVATYSVFGATAVLSLALAFLCVEAIEERSRSGS
ncbi:hypothetical protein AB1M95_13720 [Sulfitobacter sp. LCG007]